LARKFLYVIAALATLAIAAAFAFALFGNRLITAALAPRGAFTDAPAVAANAYDSPALWFARPGLAGNPALWVPAGYAVGAHPAAAVFFIHPTSSVDRDHWNAPVSDQDAAGRASIFLRGQASAFNEVGEVWAPRYRQATFGAFLSTSPDAGRALGLAYRDVLAAFDVFLREIGPTRPIILAGHSQGALHLTHLLADRVAGTPLSKRVVAAYVVGWPVSEQTDLPAMGLPQCTAPAEAGCLLSWASFAEPADPSLFTDRYDASTGFDGRSRRGTSIVCTNPLTGTPDGAAPAAANLGTLYPTTDLANATIVPGKVPARCDPRGFLLIGSPPDLPAYVLPGNNYHVYDYSLFWANVRADAARRLATWAAARPKSRARRHRR
jgi:hypothetical protein